ncbi:LysE family translocator [Rahnella variigena]|jgi:threonine/homoserine/homoserine lactone efflux protein|uniref:LysE family translocator n=1 Tax=Rahnella variigena TaxID=574964 RepID=UPI00244A71CF|nr:LysE family translocator [Rahnella variigena]MDH2897513.1 LysE family translocator [Rahnella variigena]
MTVTESLLSYALAAGILTLTPGLDTALVLRTAASQGSKKALLSAFGISTGCLIWGAMVALGLGAVLAASEMAFTLLKWTGAAYLAWLGLQMLLKPRSEMNMASPEGNGKVLRIGNSPFIRGLFGNVLNPKVGVFYVSFLPQFVATGYPVGPYIFGLAAMHAVIGTLWSITMISATRPLSRWLRRPAVVRTLDRLTGTVFLAFAVRLAMTKR